ncbi:TPA: ABC transporter permease, partial [Streptococcus suis]
MRYWKLELLKFKRNVGLDVILFLTTVIVLFQSYTGFITKEIPSKALYATGLDLLSMIIFPVLIPMVISLSHHSDKENSGVQSLFLKGVNLKELRLFQWLFYIVSFPILFFMYFTIVLVFIGLRGENILVTLYDLIPYLLLVSLSIIVLVNISFCLYHVAKQNSLVPILISLAGAILGTFPFGDYLWLGNPYSYL